MDTLRDYVNLAIAAISSVNREDFKRVYRDATSETHTKNFIHDRFVAVGKARWALFTAWGDLWAKPGWDLDPVLTSFKSYAQSNLQAYLMPLKIRRAGIKVMLLRHTAIREGRRATQFYVPKDFLK